MADLMDHLFDFIPSLQSCFFGDKGKIEFDVVRFLEIDWQGIVFRVL